jgi:hypothetical protein
MNISEIEKMVGAVISQNPELQKMIKTVSVFGSHARGTATEKSDIDLLVEFSEVPDLIQFISYKHLFEDFSKRKIDFLTAEMLSKYFRDDVVSQSKKIYG